MMKEEFLVWNYCGSCDKMRFGKPLNHTDTWVELLSGSVIKIGISRKLHF
jgi:hypothetical protein